MLHRETDVTHVLLKSAQLPDEDNEDAGAGKAVEATAAGEVAMLSVGGACAGVGVGPEAVVGVAKAARLGGGPKTAPARMLAGTSVSGILSA